jgi:hypothetical protein
MPLADEIRVEIQAFIAGRRGAYELGGWLDSVAAEVHAEGDATLRALTDRAFSLLAEVSDGDRTVEDARRELAALAALTARSESVEA